MRQKSSLRGLEELSACVGKDVRDAKRRQSARGFRTHLVGRAPRATRVASMITRATRCCDERGRMIMITLRWPKDFSSFNQSSHSAGFYHQIVLPLPRLPHAHLQKMSGVLRAAAPLARRLNAVPKGPVNRATRGMACASPPAFPHSIPTLTGRPWIFALLPVASVALPHGFAPLRFRARANGFPRYLTPQRVLHCADRSPVLPPLENAADPNATPKVAYPWLDPSNPANWKEEHVVFTILGAWGVVIFGAKTAFS